MVGVFFMQLILNAVFFSFLFWGLTFAAKYTYSNKFYNYKLNFYECGFKAYTRIDTNYDVNFLLVLLFLLIYDGEFLILLPYSLSPDLLTYQTFSCILFFMLWFIITFIFDYAYHALEWQI